LGSGLPFCYSRHSSRSPCFTQIIISKTILQVIPSETDDGIVTISAGRQYSADTGSCPDGAVTEFDPFYFVGTRIRDMGREFNKKGNVVKERSRSFVNMEVKQVNG